MVVVELTFVHEGVASAPAGHTVQTRPMLSMIDPNSLRNCRPTM